MREIDERMAALFERCPALVGFTLQPALADAAGGLMLAEVTVDSWPDRAANSELCEEIGRTLLDILEERPGSSELLGGRTFARAMH